MVSCRPLYRLPDVPQGQSLCSGQRSSRIGSAIQAAIRANQPCGEGIPADGKLLDVAETGEQKRRGKILAGAQGCAGDHLAAGGEARGVLFQQVDGIRDLTQVGTEQDRLVQGAGFLSGGLDRKTQAANGDGGAGIADNGRTAFAQPGQLQQGSG